MPLQLRKDEMPTPPAWIVRLSKIMYDCELPKNPAMLAAVTLLIRGVSVVDGIDNRLCWTITLDRAFGKDLEAKVYFSREEVDALAHEDELREEIMQRFGAAFVDVLNQARPDRIIPDRSKHKMPGRLELTQIISPLAGDTLTNPVTIAGGFTPDPTVSPVIEVTAKHANGTETTVVASISPSNLTWQATFQSLPAGVYEFKAKIAGANEITVANVTVQ